MTECDGCYFGVEPRLVTNVWVNAGFQLPPGGSWPNGACVENDDGGCDQAGCFPVGNVVVTSLVQTPVRIHYRTFPVGWADYTIAHIGQAIPIDIPGFTIACGGELKMAEVYNDATEPPTLIQEVFLVCSKCLQSV